MEKIVSEWVLYNTDGWQGHICPLNLLPGLMQDAHNRHHPLGSFEVATRSFLDLPGMILADRRLIDIHIDGLLLTIPAQDFEYFYRELKNSKLRKFENGSKYYKLHGWMQCLVIAEYHRDELLSSMTSLISSAKKTAEEEDRILKEGIRGAVAQGANIVSKHAPESIPKIHVSGKPNNNKN